MCSGGRCYEPKNCLLASFPFYLSEAPRSLTGLNTLRLLYLLNEDGSQLSISVEMLLPNQSLAPRCPVLSSSARGLALKVPKDSEAPHDERRAVRYNQHRRTNQKVPSQPSLKNLTVARGIVYIVDRIYTQFKSIISLPSIRGNSAVMCERSVTIPRLLKVYWSGAADSYQPLKSTSNINFDPVFLSAMSLKVLDVPIYAHECIQSEGCRGSNQRMNHCVFVCKEKQSTQATMKPKIIVSPLHIGKRTI